MVEKITATARATVILEIRGLGSWGEGTSMEQIYKQAATAALGKISRITETHGEIRILGEPKVTCILSEKD